MNRARVLCVPSVKASNGMEDSLPLVVLEAEAMGLPVVAFASGGISEEVIEGGTALLAPERDVSALAHHLEVLFTDPALWVRLSASGPAFVRERFNLHRQTAELETLHDRVRSTTANRRGQPVRSDMRCTGTSGPITPPG